MSSINDTSLEDVKVNNFDYKIFFVSYFKLYVALIYSLGRKYYFLCRSFKFHFINASY